ncbi:Serine/threonine-protein phosphatase 6 regulatory subunit 3 [Schistosoma japonicum]|nr:Serine/threonine-protein phosphatase 6 regulatory subunit 3 [Schistosoma japonicum]
MFWTSVAAYSKINDLLLQPDLTVKELLDDDDVLQKCREKDPLLISFLSQSDTLDCLIDLVSHTPVSDDFDENLYKYSSLACEILTNDISEILDGIIELTTPAINQHHNSNEFNNNNNNKNNSNNNMMETKDITSSSPTSSSPLSSLMILGNHNLTDTNNSNCDNMLIVDNNSYTTNNNFSELCQINSNHNENPSGNHNGNDIHHSSSSMSIVDESSSISNQDNHSLSNNDNSENDLHELFSSHLKLSPPMSLSTPQSSRIETATTTSNTNIDKVSPTITRRRVDTLIKFFNCSNQSVNPLSASFVSRLLIHLTLHRGNVIIPYLRLSKDFLDQLLSSLDSCSVADLIVQLAQQETKQQHIIFEWFKTDRLVERLIEKFDPIYSFETHESAAHCLIELITVLRNYLINNPPTLDTSDMLGDSAIPTTTDIATHSNNSNNSRNLSGLSLSSSFSNDEETYKAAENLLNILER